VTQPSVAIAERPRHNKRAYAQPCDRDPARPHRPRRSLRQEQSAAAAELGHAQRPARERARPSGRRPAVAGLNPKPRNYTDPAWQASVTDDQIKEIILKGGAGMGKSPLMPAQPQLGDKPEVLDGLVKIIRGFGKHP
jgi:hypothetical protein